MSSTTTKVPFGQKVAFGVGMLANQLFPAMLGIFIVILIDKLGFPGWMLSAIYFVPKLFDAVTDPIMGFITDNTKSKWGRRRQYVIIGALITGISFAFMWQLYAHNSVDYNFYYFMITSLFFYLGITIFSVPFVAMGYEMSDDFHERTSIMATSQLIGQLAWVFAPWLWVIMYDVSFFPSAEEATRTLAVYAAIFCTFLAVIPGIFIKSKSTLNENYEPLNLKNASRSFDLIIKGFKEALKIVPFRKLCIATFFIFNAFNTTAGFSFFIIKYYLFNGDGQGIWPTLFGCVGALFTTFLIIPVVARMSRVMGKKKAFTWSQGISIIGYVSLLFLFVPGKPYLFLFALPFISFGIGSLFTLMMSMTSDVIDIDELNTGKRREGIFGAIYWWMVKFGLAIAGLLSGLILSFIDFKSGAATQTYETMFELRLFFSAIPMIGTLFAIWVMSDYNVDEKKAREISLELAKRKAFPKQSSSYPSRKLLLDKTGISFNSKSDIDFSSKSSADIKALFSKSLHEGIYGLCFSPYSEGQTIGDVLSENQIVKRMEVIAPYTKWVRSFSCTDGNEFIPKVAHDKGLKTIVGAWISSDKVKNDKEIEALIRLAKAGYVDVAVVGNEVLLRNELTVNDIINYIKKIKEAIPNIPVSYVDTYFQFHEQPSLVEHCDIILANCYPFWEGCSIEQAPLYLKQMYEVAKNAANGKPVMITETGWPNKGESTNSAEPSEENAMKYFINVNNWSKESEIPLFYFSSFDESWKVHHEGELGQRWGLWDKNENLKY